MDICKPDPSDIDALERMETGVFTGDRLSRRSLKRLLTSPSAELRIATLDGEIVGYGLLLLRRNSRVGRLYSLAVGTEYAGKGIGRSLLVAIERTAHARKCDVLRLEVRIDNSRAIALYHRLGYRDIGRRKTYYADGTDALRLEKELGSSISETGI